MAAPAQGYFYARDIDPPRPSHRAASRRAACFFWIECFPARNPGAKLSAKHCRVLALWRWVVKQISGMAMTAMLAIMLAACAGGGAEGGGSSITTYGTVDVGVSHTSK